MRRTQTLAWSEKQVAIRQGRHRYNNVCEQPYYLKPVAENPYLGTQHDGVSTEYNTGYSVKPIHHLYRFTHNVLPENIPRMNCKSPWGKRLHWLEVTNMVQLKTEYCVFELIPPFCLTVLILTVTAFHLLRVAFYHPDITWYNVAFPTNKSFVQFVRFNQKHQLEQPVYRYFQQQSEFYFKDGHKRALLEFETVVNDPFINHVKEIGRGDELSVSVSHGNKGDKSRGTTGRGHLIPSVYQEKSSWYTPYAERMKTDPETTFAQSHGSSTFWSVYTNLWRNP